MSSKRKIVIAIAIVLVVGSVVMLRKAITPTQNNTTLHQFSNTEQAKEVLVPVTPDAAVDAIVDDAAADNTSLDDALGAERSSVSATSKDINTLSQSYDETKL